jgi:hypothetical protein
LSVSRKPRPPYAQPSRLRHAREPQQQRLAERVRARDRQIEAPPTDLPREAQHAAETGVLVLAAIDDRLVDAGETIEDLRAARQHEDREMRPRAALLQGAQERRRHHDVADPVRHADEDALEGLQGRSL